VGRASSSAGALCPRRRPLSHLVIATKGSGKRTTSLVPQISPPRVGLPVKTARAAIEGVTRGPAGGEPVRARAARSVERGSGPALECLKRHPWSLVRGQRPPLRTWGSYGQEVKRQLSTLGARPTPRTTARAARGQTPSAPAELLVRLHREQPLSKRGGGRARQRGAGGELPAHPGDLPTDVRTRPTKNLPRASTLGCPRSFRR